MNIKHNHKYHIVYRTHNLINGKEYTGKHSTDNLNDGYYGSGRLLRKAVEKYGIENFAVEILSFHDSAVNALEKEEQIVDEEYVWRDDTYNENLGGYGWNGFSGIGKTLIKNGDKNEYVDVTDPRFLSGELPSIHKGLIVVKDNNGNKFTVSKDDPRYLSGELVGHTKGMTILKDMNNNRVYVNKNDTRYLSGELVGLHKDRIIVKDKDGNKFQVSKDDPRYLSGELVGHTEGMVSVKDKDGNTMQISVDDPRYLSGELVHVCKGFSHINRQCPHCGKKGRGPNMTRYHFDKCKFK